MIWSDASAHAAASGPSPGGTSIEVPLDDMDQVHHEVELVRSPAKGKGVLPAYR